MEKIKLNLEKPIVFYPQLSKALGGALEALYFQQLYYWSDKGGRKDGWVYKTKNEMEEETTLTIRQQDRIRKKLIKDGLLETKIMKANGSPTLHYKLNIRILQKVILEYDKMSDSNHTKSKIPITENTTENTTDTLSSKEDEEFSFKNKLEEMEKSNQRHIQIICIYWKYKNFQYKNKEQYQSAIRRELRPAKNLIGYSNEEIIDVMELLEENVNFAWKLETVHKFIDEPEQIETFKK